MCHDIVYAETVLLLEARSLISASVTFSEV